MLKIKNIGRIVGNYSNGREIIEAGDYIDVLRKTGKEYFVFRIAPQRDGNDYNKEHDIVLAKIPELNGKYRMFNMGFQIATEIQVSMDEIRIPTELSRCIRNVLVKTQTFYQQNK
jgi:hypothetical protein